MIRSLKNPLLLLALIFVSVAVVSALLWWSIRPLGTTTFADGTEIVFEQYTFGTLHEFRSPDKQPVLKRLPAWFRKAIRCKTPFHATRTESAPCTVLWVRVRWPADRVAPLPSDLHVQAVEKDGTAYSWMLSGVYRLNATELMLPYRVESLPPPGGRLSVRVVEKLEQRRALVGHLPKDEVARDAHLRPAKEQTSNTVLLPNPSRVKSTDTAPPPLPQTQEYDGLRATLRGVAVKPLGGGEFTVEPQVELRWNGGELANAFRHYWSISTPGGPRTEPGYRLSVFIDSMPEYPPQPHMLPTAPMRGHQAWTLHLNVVSTAAFPELVNERGLPLFSTPVAARRQKGAPPPPEPAVSPEATDAGLGLADVWPPTFLRLVVQRTPERWFPAGWKGNGSDPLPFVVVAEADGKRIVLRSSSAGGGYGKYGLACYDFGVDDVAQRLAYGERWSDTIERVPPGERPALPATVDYRVLPRRYWKFAFLIVPPEVPDEAGVNR